jgi:hypothetical protein
MTTLSAFHDRPVAAAAALVFHSRDFPFSISRDPDNFSILAFPGNRSGIPGNRINQEKMYILQAFPVISINY